MIVTGPSIVSALLTNRYSFSETVVNKGAKTMLSPFAAAATTLRSDFEFPSSSPLVTIKAGQTLPDGVTPPDFYVPGEGLMTWKNIVTDNGSYDLNPGVGEVTIRVCSVRAAEVVGDKGSGGGCDAAAGAGFAPLALLLVAPLCAFARPKGSVRK